MQTPYARLGRHALWLPDNAHALMQQPSELSGLLNDRGSLTAALKHLSGGDFAVRLLAQRRFLPYPHEQRKLSRPLHKAAMIREVELLVRGTPVVYARSIVPLSLIGNTRSGLANLGKTPLGHLLFNDGKIRVSKRQFAFIDCGNDLAKESKDKIAARRTPYEYHGNTILVAEFFLPAIDQFIHQA